MQVTARGVRWSVGAALIVDGVDCTMPEGAMTGLLGPNGAGKTSLLRILAGIVSPQAGVVLADGTDVHALGRRDRARRIALLEQEADATVPLTVLDVVLLGRIPHRPGWAGWSATGDAEDRRIGLAALATTGMVDLADRTWATLSGGERQRVQIARALAQQPQLLLLDEPTNHLDVSSQLHLLGFVRRLGLTTVAALHDLNLAAAYCDQVVVLSHGRVVTAGPPQTVLVPDLVRDVYGVRAHVLTHPTTGRPVIAFDDEGAPTAPDGATTGLRATAP